jgi:ubiquinone/menaquinone biosynthesis C-methylase UbiE
MTTKHPFDRLARPYRWLEAISFGPLLHWCRTVHLPNLAECQSALVVGDGDGRFLAALLASNTTIRVQAIDISPKMTELAKQRTAFAADRVTFNIGDVRQIKIPAGGYDLIVTNFLLDCFPLDQLRMVTDRLARVLEKNGRWLVGDFAKPTRPLTALIAKIGMAAMYFVFRCVARIPARQLTDPTELLQAHGLQKMHQASRLDGWLVSRVWQRVSSVS